MARGLQRNDVDVTAMEMTKWFDTNYHYIVPEFEPDMNPALSSTALFDQHREAQEQGIQTRPVLIGPASFLFLGKAHYPDFGDQAGDETSRFAAG